MTEPRTIEIPAGYKAVLVSDELVAVFACTVAGTDQSGPGRS